MQRLRAWFAATHSGGTGAPPGVTMDPRQELADRIWRARANASLRQNILREARPGDRKNAADGAPRGGCVVQATQHHKD